MATFVKSLPLWSSIVECESHVHCLHDGRTDGRTLLALGAERTLRIDREDENTLEAMQQFLDENQGDWVFAVLSYELKNTVEALSSERSDLMGFPVSVLTVPRTVIRFDRNGAEILRGEEDEAALAAIEAWERGGSPQDPDAPKIRMRPRWDEATYAQRWGRVQRHLRHGDIYEMNLCTTWVGDGPMPAPWNVFDRLQRRTQAPHGAFVRIDSCYALCGSPERYLQRRGKVLRSQPIKGTARRGADAREDADLAYALEHDPKERAENIMITDLVRNDLSRVAQRGTVHVEELCGIHTFETVHQMISSIACTVSEEVRFTDILRASFPMGSMTGAPKIRAMQLIDELEANRRGWYSGSIGCIEPNGDFDFNVVIRTVLHNSATGKTSFEVGGAITVASSAEGEYEECLLKAKALLDTLGSDGPR